MRIPISWLEDYVDLPPLDALLMRLTEIGHMVDGPLQPTADRPVIPLEIRQNRPDCLSIYGIAREVGAAFAQPVKELTLADLPAPVAESGRVDSSDDVCFLYLRDVKLPALPSAMLRKLESVGQRPVSPVVDLLNYVMFELGQPLHSYAAERVDLASMHARPAQTGEHLPILDGRTLMLTPDDLVVADRSGPLALAGVLGGSASAVDHASVEIVVEAGTFRPHLVRRTARHHAVASEAALRSSKLLPPALAHIALARVLHLLVAFGAVETVELWQAGQPRHQPRAPIQLEHAELQRIGGLDVPPAQSAAILTGLGFADARHDENATIHATPPWWRTDVEHPADLIDEIVRIAGYTSIPPAVLPALARRAPTMGVWEQEEQLRHLLCAWGYDEVILDSFVTDEPGGSDERADLVVVENSPTGNRLLRPSLLRNIIEP